MSLASELRRALDTALSQAATAQALKNGNKVAATHAAHAEAVGRVKGLEAARQIVLDELQRFEVDEDD